MKKNLLIVGAVVALILLLDQFSKIYIKTNFELFEQYSIFDEWFILDYIENPGMAFGTTFGNQMWHKLALSIFRIIAITGICIYWYKQAKAGVRLEFLIAIGFILAGATGNLIDSMLYDFIFPYNPCLPSNILPGSGVWSECPPFEKLETRHTGFLLGNVVDMFHFTAQWPSWVPWYNESPKQPSDNEIFPAIWNVADAAITTGVAIVFIRQRKYFPKKKDKENIEQKEEDEKNIEQRT